MDKQVLALLELASKKASHMVSPRSRRRAMSRAIGKLTKKVKGDGDS